MIIRKEHDEIVNTLVPPHAEHDMCLSVETFMQALQARPVKPAFVISDYIYSRYWLWRRLAAERLNYELRVCI